MGKTEFPDHLCPAADNSTGLQCGCYCYCANGRGEFPLQR